LPEATPGLELQDEDYSVARSNFKTSLVRKGPSPQKWDPGVRPYRDVTVLTYRSGELSLKAWINQPRSEVDKKHPAVLYLHSGWAFDEDDWDETEPLRKAGYVVMIPLLRGENGQSGHFSVFYDEITDVLAAADVLAEQPFVDAERIFIAGHSEGGTEAMLAAMSSNRFRAVASFSGPTDAINLVRQGNERAAPFETENPREYQMRSPVAYATSFKCPARLYYGSGEKNIEPETRRTAILAKKKGLDVEAVEVPPDQIKPAPEAMRQAIEFFKSR